jgi:chemotaxis receptor (MCP) glutamine deamidase CheD
MGNLKKYHVASGSFEVGDTDSRLLQAFLGTCVGVAVFDDTAGVGGSSICCCRSRSAPEARTDLKNTPPPAYQYF